KNHPDDIYPIVLTTATQERFECCVNEDVTEERPYKLLKKDDIIQDIKMRAAVSDFSPVKQIVLDYIEEEMLLVFDIKFTYGQSFYLVLTPEAKARIYKPPQPEIIEVFEDDLSKTPEPKPWISLGSELEIDEESVKETREKFSKVRRTFGAPVCFSDRNAADAKDSLLRFASYQDSRFSIKLMQRDCRTQAVPRLQSSSAQTQWYFHRDVFTQYEPRDLSEEEIESILSSENLKTFCNSVIPRVLHALQQEIIMNIFTDDFKVLGTGGEAADRLVKVSEGLVLHQAFTDQKHTKGKKISSVNWHPTIPGLIAVALTKKREKQLDESTTHIISPAFIVFYSFSDPANPQLLLECPDDIATFEFCPSNPDIIVGGCMNGQVLIAHHEVDNVVYLSCNQDLDDIKENKTPVLRYCAVSAVESSHKSPVTDVQWLPRTFEVRGAEGQKGLEGITTAGNYFFHQDTVMFWDLRVPKLQSQPLADRKQNVDQKTPTTTYSVPETFKHLHRTWKPLFRVLQCLGCNTERVLCVEPELLLTSNVFKSFFKFSLQPQENQVNCSLLCIMIALEGNYCQIKQCSFSICLASLPGGKPLLCFGTHHWSVNTIQRSPFFKDVILTTGGWNFAIWKEDVMDGPIFVTPSSEQECTVGCWSLSRPAVFFIGKEDGSIEMWNLLLNTSEPTQVYAHITNTKITCIKPWITSPKQHFLAVTDNLGMLRVLNIPKTLYSPSTNEVRCAPCLLIIVYDYIFFPPLVCLQEPDKPVKFQEDSEEENMKGYNEYLILEENTLKVMGLWPHAANTQDT
uniref:Dynein axonemal intermediate chain 3 n=1 Tax=Amphilophus citrinellus TaxID=61819 RepID=A0A3Q0RVD9_AMPCI